MLSRTEEMRLSVDDNPGGGWKAQGLEHLSHLSKSLRSGKRRVCDVQVDARRISPAPCARDFSTPGEPVIQGVFYVVARSSTSQRDVDEDVHGVTKRLRLQNVP